MNTILETNVRNKFINSWIPYNDENTEEFTIIAYASN